MRKLATIQKIKEVKDHPNADRLSLLAFENIGWQCVSKKGEFKNGDLCVYLEIDSLISMKHEWARFLQDKNDPSKPARLRTVRLRSELSQGLAIPISAIPELKDREIEEGEDLTDLLEIKKYEPKVPPCLNGQVKGRMPGYIKKTDEERIQAYPELIKEFQGVMVYITQKIDGTSGTFVHKDGVEDVCGRNWSYLEDDKNTYWEVAKKYDILPKLKDIREKTGKNYAAQGEIHGEGIQKNRLGIKGHDLAVFNVIDLSGQKPLDFYEFKEFCERLQLVTVPILQICEFKWQTLEELLELAKGKYGSGKDQEGIVIRPIREFRSEVLKGRASFKVINNEFLEKGGD